MTSVVAKLRVESVQIAVVVPDKDYMAAVEPLDEVLVPEQASRMWSRN